MIHTLKLTIRRFLWGTVLVPSRKFERKYSFKEPHGALREYMNKKIPSRNCLEPARNYVKIEPLLVNLCYLIKMHRENIYNSYV